MFIDMKTRLTSLLLLFALCCPAITSGEQPNKKGKQKTVTVYICTGPKAKRFHAHRNCRGLNKCSAEIVAISLDKAQNNGYTPCKICY